MPNEHFNTKRTWGPEPRYDAVRAYNPPSDDFITIAGPCSVENQNQLVSISDVLSKLGITYMRGGVYRAGTYPPRNFGLQKQLLYDFKSITKLYGLKIIVEVLDVRQVEEVAGYVDALQVGTRHMQDYALLKEVAKFDGVVTLKRGVGSTLDEFLGAAEYLCQGICRPILIERGSSSYHNHVRWDLSVSIIAAIKKITKMPIIVDASHGSGRRDLVEPLTLAGIAAGADGFLCEVHPEPEKSLSDAEQAYPLSKYEKLKKTAQEVHKVVNGVRMAEVTG